MKKIIAYVFVPVISSMLVSAFAVPRNIDNYAGLQKALEQGESVSAIIHFDRCTAKPLSNKADTSGASTRINFDIFSHYKVIVDGKAKFTVATSSSILTEHSVFGPVFAYGRLRVFEDNSAEFHAAYYDPKTYELKGGMNFECRIDGGDSQAGVVLLDKSS